MHHQEKRQPFDRVPDELQELDQWVNWRDEEGRKVPKNPRTQGNAGVNWPGTWSGFGQAREEAMQRELGMGFVLTEHDPYTCIDLDNCVGRDGQIDMQTREILDLLSGWVELSPSNRGLHVWVRNDRPISRRSKELEIYSYGRWMSVTGRSNPAARLEIPERTDAVQELVEWFMPETETVRLDLTPSQPVPLSDLEIWDQLFSGEKGEFYTRLFDGDLSVCRDDHSLAVILLANQLACLTDFDAPRMKRLLYESLLARDKWQEKRGDVSWIDHQIQDAIAYMSGRQE